SLKWCGWGPGGRRFKSCLPDTNSLQIAAGEKAVLRATRSNAAGAWRTFGFSEYPERPRGAARMAGERHAAVVAAGGRPSSRDARERGPSALTIGREQVLCAMPSIEVASAHPVHLRAVAPAERVGAIPVTGPCMATASTQ